MSAIDVPAPRESSLSPSPSRLKDASVDRIRRRLGPLRHRSAESASSASSSASPKHTEFEITTVNKVDAKFVCPVCTQLLRYPLQFQECGHRCCSTCLPEILRIAPRCPVDQTKIDKHKMFVDRGFQRELDAVKVRCSFHVNGCQWTGEMRDLVPHAELCPVRQIPCPNDCGAKIGQSSISRHVKESCPNAALSCVCCLAPIRARDEIEHMRRCEKFPVYCPNGCGVKDLPRSEMPDHLKECKRQPVYCPYLEAGCIHQCMLRDLDDHLSSDYERHLAMVAQTMGSVSAADTDARVSELTDRLLLLQARLNNLRKIHAPFTLWKIEDFDEKCRKARSLENSAIRSPHLSTGRHGYRLQVHAYLYGEEIVQGRFMSIQLNICQNNYDCIVKWPFTSRITVTLLDQCVNPNARRHVSHVLDPVVMETKGAFDRPKGGKDNGPFGVTKFIHLDDLLRPGHYVKDDCLFIHVKIDDD